MHAYGLAIDVNTVQNPYLEPGFAVQPPAGAAYVGRSDIRPGMAYPWGILVAAFSSNAASRSQGTVGTRDPPARSPERAINSVTQNGSIWLRTRALLLVFFPDGCSQVTGAPAFIGGKLPRAHFGARTIPYGTKAPAGRDGQSLPS
jgi:hypothetical protein